MVTDGNRKTVNQSMSYLFIIYIYKNILYLTTSIIIKYYLKSMFILCCLCYSIYFVVLYYSFKILSYVFQNTRFDAKNLLDLYNCYFVN